MSSVNRGKFYAFLSCQIVLARTSSTMLNRNGKSIIIMLLGEKLCLLSPSIILAVHFSQKPFIKLNFILTRLLNLSLFL